MIELIETTLFYLIRFFSSTIEMLFAFLMMNVFFERKYISRIPTTIAFILSSGILLALQETGQSGTLKALVQTLLILFVVFILYDGKKRLKAFFFVAYSLFVALSKLLSFFAFSFVIDKAIGTIPYLTKESFFYRILSIELPNIFMLVIIILMGLFTKSKNKSVPLRYWLLLFIVPLTTLGTLTVYQYYADRLAPGDEINAYIIISTIGLVVINILIFFLFSRLQSQLELQKNQLLISTQMRLEKQSFQKMEESYNRTREIRHDMKNHIISLKGIAENGNREQLLNYLEKMTDALEEATYISFSKNSAVDAIINEKLLIAQRNNISTHFDILPLNSENVPSMDICTILSNALDNAIEACLKIDNPTERYINVRITADNGIFISVANPTAHPPKKRAGVIISSKNDKENHGLGLKSIKRTVEKHNGDILIKYEKGIFTLIAQL
ncbi:MAG: GHKL domain-containing protein [Clostridia bacterium]|nr:GHKL domain-containing protein [Clostridia bacterium]